MTFHSEPLYIMVNNPSAFYAITKWTDTEWLSLILGRPPPPIQSPEVDRSGVPWVDWSGGGDSVPLDGWEPYVVTTILRRGGR